MFGVQLNFDPRHRDPIAFVGVCSGRVDRGMSLACARTGRRQTAKYAHQAPGQDRTTVHHAFPGHVAVPADRSRVKEFRGGLHQFEQEGVIQILRHPGRGDQEPLPAAVGALQFEVTTHCMEHEFNAPLLHRATRMPVARRTCETSVDVLARLPDVAVSHRGDGTPIALFRDRWQAGRIEPEHPELTLDTIVTN